MGTAAASLHMRTEDLCVLTTPPNSLQASSRKKHLPQLTLRGLSHSFASIASAKEIPMYDIICKSAIYCCQKAAKFAFSQNKLQKQINQAENQLISCLIFGPANRFEAAVQKGIRIPTRSSMRNIRSLRAAVPGIGGHDRLAVGLYAAVSWLQRRNMAAASAQVASAWGLISEPSPVPRMIPAPQAHCMAAMALSDTWAASA